MLQEAPEVTRIGVHQHDAGAHLAHVQLAKPVVALGPHPLPVKEPVDAPVEDRVGVEPDELLELDEVPDLELPVRYPPVLVHELLPVPPGHLHSVHGLDAHVQPLEGLGHARAVGEVRRVREQHQRVLRPQPLQRAGDGHHAPEVLWIAGRVLVTASRTPSGSRRPAAASGAAAAAARTSERRNLSPGGDGDCAAGGLCPPELLAEQLLDVGRRGPGAALG
eukprot:CAMPEP_0168403522 /NCGR_PEP_ID=MMETSP0228-20121227/24169_1 /TAXON_ID=133427 /ORGANISM="Protoceratium reticulatum, Strain CCCM 535 (=CCMP 1889)" /LENGTH=220 /DNA_ID=CAMNT_0008417121 /DNA_START=694 /DNA_END=1352 /DNA_ORIENTATION=-